MTSIASTPVRPAQPAEEDSIPDRIGREVARRVGARRWDMWFDRTTDFVVEDGSLRIRADSRFVADWIERHFREAIQTAARAELGDAAKVSLEVRHRPGEDATSHDGTEGRNQDGPHAAPPDRSRARNTKRLRRDRRDAGPTLAGFEVGDSNRLAFDAAQRVADDLDGAASILFVHGDCGIGKTHLLRGLCQRRQEFDRTSKVRYLTGEQFTNEYIHAVRNKELDGFRKSLRRLDLLAIDDVQFLSNKSSTQSEFLHTLDQLAMSGATIVVASDAHPRTVHRFSGPLTSRFLSGMVVQVDRPDRDLRLRLTRRLAADRGMKLSESATDTLAGRCVGSVRELLGGIARIDALARIDGLDANREIGSISVQRALGDESTSTGGRPIRLGRIIEVVCEAVNVDRDELLSTGRHRRVVLARGLCAYLAREMTNACFPEIATSLGRTTHSTVHTADRRIRRQLEADEQVTSDDGESTLLRDLVDEIRRTLRRG
ncbi:MAG: DnaA/Hda family protein [Planctomycetota bacterium]|nr:DnaA/Hda family protein [Planctomycetota bacterium]MEE2895110.1 DnaA/Hda family protein [Planctomycetota bacterium]